MALFRVTSTRSPEGAPVVWRTMSLVSTGRMAWRAEPDSMR